MNKYIQEITDNIQLFLTEIQAKYDFIPANLAENMIDKLSEKYGFDRKHRYLWSIRDETLAIDYGEEPDVFGIIVELLEKFKLNIVLVITDDEFAPWPAFKFEKQYLIQVLQDNRFFEFFIFDSSMNYVLFDTHDNFLFFYDYKLIANK